MEDMARVLVIDDDLACRVLAALLLEQAGHSPTAVASVERALERMVDARVDVVVTDLNMPGRDGIDLLGLMRERRLAQPVIVMTGSDDDTLIARTVELGATAVLRKPYGAGELEAAVAAALRRGEAQPHAA
jgi:two-component system, OmpR family, KDP operon response regulator KdpE